MLIIINCAHYLLSDGGSEYRRSLRHLSKFNDELNDKKRIADQVASAKIARLEQYQQLHSCERDAKQVWYCTMALNVSQRVTRM